MNGTEIWAIIGSVVAPALAILAAFIKARANKYLVLLKMIIEAFDDGDITKEEFTAIVSYTKSILKK
jgi:hypothetical protein